MTIKAHTRGKTDGKRCPVRLLLRQLLQCPSIQLDSARAGQSMLDWVNSGENRLVYSEPFHHISVGNVFTEGNGLCSRHPKTAVTCAAQRKTATGACWLQG